MNAATKSLFEMGTLFALLLCVTCTGAFAISAERHEKAKISREIAERETSIKQLKRENEELTVKIAEQESPRYLGMRAGARLALPKADTSIVWAYENYDGGRVEFSGKNKKYVSFRTPEKEGKLDK